MTTNGAIGAVNLAIALTIAAMAGVALWQARPAWREWPPGFLVAVGGWFLTLALFTGQLAIFRWFDPPGTFSENGVGTLGLRLLCLGFSLALLRRLVTGTLATDGDRRRAAGGTG